MALQDPSNILRELHSNGVNLSVGELIQYQQQTRMLDLSPRRTPQARLAGSYITKHKGRGMEFDEARHYLPGDDIRAIDWRVTARTGKTHTKIYREERERPVFILCDMSSSMNFGTQLMLKSVQAGHLTALIAWTAAQRGDKVGALIFNDSVHKECKPMARKRSVLNICHELCTVQNASVTQSEVKTNPNGFSDACARLRRLAKPGSLVYLISDFQKVDDIAKQHLMQLSKHCEIHGFVVSDPLENTLPDIPVIQPVTVTDGTQKQTWILGDKTQAKRYMSHRLEHTKKMQSYLESCRASVSHISAGDTLKSQFVLGRSETI